MRNILSTFVALLLVLCVVSPALGEERSFPQSDYFLYLGVRSAAAGIGPGKIERIVFSSAHVDVKAGKVHADRDIPVSFTQGVEDFNGTAHLTMDGEYDKSDGRLHGTFTLVSAIHVVWHGAFDSNTDWVETVTGTFNGQVVDERVAIRYTGKSNSESHEGMADGKVKNRSEVNDYASIVAWRLSEYTAPEAPVISELDKEFLDKNGNAVDSRARFGSREGQVEIHIPGEPEDSWHIANPLTVIPYGARIKTDEDSGAIISFPDHTTFKLKPESTIIIAGPPDRSDSKWKLVAGNIWVNVQKMMKDGTMEYDLNQAVAGKKGTTFVASQVGDTSVFKVLEGEMFVKAKNSDETADIIGGEMATVDASGKITREKFDIVKEQDTWDTPEKIDFATLEKSISPEPVAPATSAPSSRPYTPYVAVIGGIIVVGILAKFLLRKK